jgi:type III pantothenate kinase
VRSGYEDILQLGADRWFAVVAAFEHAGNAVCVVDAGTATTVDLVDAAGQHLGGFILPGVDLMMQSLLDGTGDLARLRDRAPAKIVLDPGKTTGSAMRNGAWLATIGLIEQARTRLPAESALVVTGGQGGVLAELLGAPFNERLVLEGLALGWRAGAAG